MDSNEKKELQALYLSQLPELEKGLEQIQQVIDIIMFSNISAIESESAKAVEMKRFYEERILIANGKFPDEITQ